MLQYQICRAASSARSAQLRSRAGAYRRKNTLDRRATIANVRPSRRSAAQQNMVFVAFCRQNGASSTKTIFCCRFSECSPPRRSECLRPPNGGARTCRPLNRRAVFVIPHHLPSSSPEGKKRHEAFRLSLRRDGAARFGAPFSPSCKPQKNAKKPRLIAFTCYQARFLNPKTQQNIFILLRFLQRKK